MTERVVEDQVEDEIQVIKASEIASRQTRTKNCSTFFGLRQHSFSRLATRDMDRAMFHPARYRRPEKAERDTAPARIGAAMRCPPTIDPNNLTADSARKLRTRLPGRNRTCLRERAKEAPGAEGRVRHSGGPFACQESRPRSAPGSLALCDAGPASEAAYTEAVIFSSFRFSYRLIYTPN